MAQRFTKGDQDGWYHRVDSVTYGFFHTYDKFQLDDSVPHQIHVLLPNDYETSEKEYPTLYLNDGDWAFWPLDNTESFLAVPEHLAMLQEQHGRQVIAVGIVPADRNFEYTHLVYDENGKHGGIQTYSQFICDILVPWMNAYYRTLRGPAHTCIAGASHGGFASYYLAMTRPSRFGMCICFSPSFWMCESECRTMDYVHPDLHVPIVLRDSGIRATMYSTKIRPKIVLSWGMTRTGGEHNAVIERFATDAGQHVTEVLTGAGYQTGIDLCVLQDPHGEHDARTWKRWLGKGLLFVFP